MTIADSIFKAIVCTSLNIVFSIESGMCFDVHG